MSIFKCKMCGGDLSITENITVCECEYCGTKQTVPNADDEKKVTLFNRANRLRMSCEFDKASGIYEQIVAEFPEEAEAYWGLCLANYGIEYVDDPATARKIPTCHRASFDKMRKDENYELALENADMASRLVYEEQAKEIDRIMSEILAVSRDEEPYDIFICYKETDNNGLRTPDSVLAQDIYDALTSRGYRVFFSRITLEDKLGTQYEPYIFSALNSAKMMLVVGTDYEYMNAVWVKNEWSRFIKLMANDKSKILIPCYKDMNPYDMPDAFKPYQSQDCSKLGFMQDLTRGIDKLLGKTEQPVASQQVVVQQVKNSTTASVDEQSVRKTNITEMSSTDKSITPKRIIIGVSVVAAIVVLVIVLNSVILPASNYKKAIAQVEAGNYSEAYTIIVEMDDTSSISDSVYLCAKALQDGKDYDKAIALYEKIPEYNGVSEQLKYCKLINEIILLKVGDTFVFGEYEQDNNTSNGKEEIEWRILAKEGNKLLITSEKALDCKKYNTEYTKVTWETCSLRKWLNNEFYTAAFNEAEQSMIATTKVTADPNPKYSTNPGNDTTDKVFLLSIDEANKYFSSDEDRKCVPTAYAIENGAWTDDTYTKNGEATCYWWLRSPGFYSDYASFVRIDGHIYDYGYNVNYSNECVRPALWIEI